MSSNVEDTVQRYDTARPSSNTRAEDSRAATDAPSISSSLSYCSSCPICNPPDPSLASVTTYDTFSFQSRDNARPHQLSFFEATIKACVKICCCDYGTPSYPPLAPSSQCSSTPYPSSLSSNSVSETGSLYSQDQASDSEASASLEQSMPSHAGGYGKQGTMQFTQHGGSG